MGWRVDVCRVILSLLCIMGGRWVCYKVGTYMVCEVDSREQRTRGIL